MPSRATRRRSPFRSARRCSQTRSRSTLDRFLPSCGERSSYWPWKQARSECCSKLSSVHSVCIVGGQELTDQSNFANAILFRSHPALDGRPDQRDPTAALSAPREQALSLPCRRSPIGKRIPDQHVEVDERELGVEGGGPAGLVEGSGSARVPTVSDDPLVQGRSSHCRYTHLIKHMDSKDGFDVLRHTQSITLREGFRSPSDICAYD